jgi:hypothetical protein
MKIARNNPRLAFHSIHITEMWFTDITDGHGYLTDDAIQKLEEITSMRM